LRARWRVPNEGLLVSRFSTLEDEGVRTPNKKPNPSLSLQASLPPWMQKSSTYYDLK